MTLSQSIAHLDDSIPDLCEDCHNNRGWFDGGGAWIECTCVREQAERDAKSVRAALREYEAQYEVRYGRKPWGGEAL
jgi:hypothetical protein